MIKHLCVWAITGAAMHPHTARRQPSAVSRPPSAAVPHMHPMLAPCTQAPSPQTASNLSGSWVSGSIMSTSMISGNLSRTAARRP